MIVRNARYKQVLPGVVGYKGNLYTKAYAKGELLFDYTNDEYETQYFTTESLEDGNVITFTIGSGVTTSNFTSIAYSTDNGTNWTTLTNNGSSEQTLSVTLNNGAKAIWKGIGERTGVVDNVIADRCTIMGSKTMNVYGNITSLLKGDNFYNNYSMSQAGTYVGLFYKDASNDANIVDASKLVLPATTLTTSCYYEMFRHCKKLLYAPKLPATTLPSSPYRGMFRDCIALLEAPELPATTLGTWCYTHMFYNCRALTKAPELPSTTINQNVYYGMFYNCKELIEAPELPAPTLYNQCYREMFSGCTKLNYIKCLATDISASNCTQNWVYNVAPTGDFVKDPSMNDWLIDNVNGIPIGWTLHGVATYTVTLTVNDANMGVADGAGTYSAGDQVVLRAEPYEGYSFVGWYDNNTLISSETTYVFNIYSNISYEARFAQSQQDEYLNKYFTIETLENNNRVILVIPADLTPQDYVSLSYSTDDGTNWTTISIDNTAKNLIVDLPVIGDKVLLKGSGNRLGVGISGCSFNCIKTYKVYGNIMSLLYGDNFTNQTTLTTNGAFSYLFSRQRGGFSYLVDASNLKLPATTLSTNCYAYMFAVCTYLIKAPELPATTLAEGCYMDMFKECSLLTQAPDLQATTLANKCYMGMFVSCSSLTTAPNLPATTLYPLCYADMFWYCTSLVNAPSLPATNVPWWAYSSMFADCTSLVNAPSLPATTLGNSCYKEMFEGCTSLTTAPALQATEAVQSCYEMMFYGCTSLITAPDLVATNLGRDCYDRMFENTKIQSLKVYGVSSSYPIDFGTINYSNGIYYTKQNATSNILNGCPTGWTISKTL